MAKPAWIDQGANDAIQLDLTGSRLASQKLETWLLDGITSVTPRIAYLGFRAWVTKRYWEARQPDAYSTFLEFAGRQEAALAVGLARDGFGGSGIIGSTKASLLAGQETVTLLPLTVLKAVRIYGASFEALGLGGATQRGVPNLSTSGAKLADAVETRLSASAYAKALAINPALAEVSTADLAKFAKAASFGSPMNVERSVLANVVFGLGDSPAQLRRRDTYAMILLLIADRPAAEQAEEDFLRASVKPARFPDFLAPTADGWAEYTALDLVAFSHEKGLEAIVGELARFRAQGMRATPPAEVLRKVVLHPEIVDLLERLRLPSPDATVADLQTALGSQCQEPVIRDGIKRWKAGWDEENIVEALSDGGAGGAGPLLAWCCAAQRIADPVRRRFARDGLWSLRGDILPFLEEYAGSRISIAMAAALHKVVVQHLRVTWGRHANDPSKINALVTSEAGRWSFVRDYRGSRMGRRYWAARGWLEQMGSFDDNGLTTSGQALLDEMLRHSREAAA